MKIKSFSFAGTAATAAAAGNGTAESGEEVDAREGKDDENDERLHDDSPLPGWDRRMSSGSASASRYG